MRYLFKHKVLLILFLLSISRISFAQNFAVDNTGGGTFCVDHSGSGGNFLASTELKGAHEFNKIAIKHKKNPVFASFFENIIILRPLFIYEKHII